MALCACESSTDPTRSLTLSAGATNSGTVGATDTAVYHLDVTAGQIFEVILESTRGPVFATIQDPTGAYSLGSSFDDGTPNSQEWTRVAWRTTGTYKILVMGYPHGSGADFSIRPVFLDPRPERAASAIRIGDTVSTEILEGLDDVDDFIFDGQQGQEINLFLQSLVAVTRPITAAIYRNDGADPFAFNDMGIVYSTGDSTDLEASALGRITLPVTGSYRLRVASPNWSHPRADIPYRVQVYGVNRAPEHAAAILIPGDTIESESIDHVGDIDEFTLRGAPGSAYNVFAVPAGAPLKTLRVDVLTDSIISRSVTSAAGDRLLDAPTGVIVLPASGQAVVRVGSTASAGESTSGQYRGPYRLFTYPVQRLPEHRAADLPLSGTTIVEDTIDQLGDVDQYRFTLRDSLEIGFRQDVGSPAAGRLAVTLTSDNPAYTGSGYGFGIDLRGQLKLPPGSYRLSVAGTGVGVRTSYRGAYQFAFAPIDTAPEHVAATVSVGDTITAEGFSWPVDRDFFHLFSAGADTVVIELSGLPSDSTFGRTLTVVNDATGVILDDPLIDEGQSRRTARLDLEAGGHYTVVVAGATPAWRPGTEQPYRLTISRASSAPEHASPSIAVGDTVHELADYRGDIDEFVLHATPGDSIYVEHGFGTLVRYQLIDPSTRVILATSSTTDGYPTTRPLNVPPGGALVIRTTAPTTLLPGGDKAPYTFSVHATSGRPEQHAAAIALGDTIKGESIDYPFDIDEFTFDATAGQVVGVSFQLFVTGTACGPPGLQTELVEQATGTVLATLSADHCSANLDDISSAAISLPSTGRYLLRVRAHNDTQMGIRFYAEYRLKVALRP